MTNSEIFKAAHKLAKTFQGDYRACFALALRIVREEAFEVEEEVFEICRDLSKPTRSATYRQFKYLSSFDNVELNINSSQFIKFIYISDASDAIKAALEGTKVIIN